MQRLAILVFLLGLAACGHAGPSGCPAVPCANLCCPTSYTCCTNNVCCQAGLCGDGGTLCYAPTACISGVCVDAGMWATTPSDGGS
jgi:hypothetical protein